MTPHQPEPVTTEQMRRSAANLSLLMGMRQTSHLIRSAADQIDALKKERDALAAFKAFVHRRLDTAKVPTHFPDGKHSKEGCRIGDRLDYVIDVRTYLDDRKVMQDEIADLRAKLAEAEKERQENMDFCTTALLQKAEARAATAERELALLYTASVDFAACYGLGDTGPRQLPPGITANSCLIGLWNVLKRVTPPAEVAKPLPSATNRFLCRGTGFKLHFNTSGNCVSMQNYAKELEGRWVALVPAEDNMHMREDRAEVAKPDHSALIGTVRTIAKKHGWAIGAHGSLDRDIDLIAAPWTAEAIPWKELVEAVASGIDYLAGGASELPNGRRCVLLFHKQAETDLTRIRKGEMTGEAHPKGRWFPPAIDLSIMAQEVAKPVVKMPKRYRAEIDETTMGVQFVSYPEDPKGEILFRASVIAALKAAGIEVRP